MSNWMEAFVFGLALLAFVTGLSSIIMALIHQPASEEVAVRDKVEYGFFGVTGLVLCILFAYAI